MIKLLALFGLCICSLWVGLGIRSNLKRKKELTQELVSITDKIKAEITFAKSFLPDIMKKISVSEEIREIIDKKGENTPFNEGETETISSFFDDLGSSDLDGEVVKLGMARSKFADMADKARASYEKNGMLAVKLSLLIGVMIVILFV